MHTRYEPLRKDRWTPGLTCCKLLPDKRLRNSEVFRELFCSVHFITLGCKSTNSQTPRAAEGGIAVAMVMRCRNKTRQSSSLRHLVKEHEWTRKKQHAETLTTNKYVVMFVGDQRLKYHESAVRNDYKDVTLQVCVGVLSSY